MSDCKCGQRYRRKTFRAGSESLRIRLRAGRTLGVDDMAQTVQTGSDIIRQLVSRVEELSEAISTHPRNNDVNSEVRNIFTGRNNQAPQARQPNASSQTTQARQAHIVQAPSREDRLPIRRNAFEVRRNFPTARRPSSSRRRGSRPAAVDNRPFLRDLVLLSGPDETLVPRQGARLSLMENGHVITACRFTKDLSPALVETTIIEAFEGKIPRGVDIELLMSVHTSLVAPTLAPGQWGIDGVILHRLFKQKPVYVRPSRPLLNITRTVNEVRIFLYFSFLY